MTAYGSAFDPKTASRCAGHSRGRNFRNCSKAKNWFAGTRGSSGEHPVSLVRHSDAVLEVFLRLARREASVVTVGLIDARSKLAEMLVTVDELRQRP
jgi:hypothetical protein